MIEIKVPEFGESIQEAQVSQWLKQEGQWVEKDEEIVELETEKASQPIAAPESGVLSKIVVAEGEFVNVGSVLAKLDDSADSGSASSDQSTKESKSAAAEGSSATSDSTTATAEKAESVMPAAQRMLSEYQISEDVVRPTGPGGRLLKEDVIRYVEANHLAPGGTGSQTDSASAKAPASAGAPTGSSGDFPVPPSTDPFAGSVAAGDRTSDRKPMSMMRRTIASRLVKAQQSAALLTTFNEIDMKPVMELRSRYKDQFLKKHGVKLGFMSFFAKASVEALRRFPAINAYIEGNDVVYHNYYDIGVAIGGGKGLVVPVLRNVEKMSFADVERQIVEYATLAKDNKVQAADQEGGTFTISNGGVYGSLLSTPIVNPPQSGILGLHSIQERPIAVDGQVAIRPMMYIALSYDHRIVDGREAVQFLKTIKEVLEEPARLFLEV